MLRCVFLFFLIVTLNFPLHAQDTLNRYKGVLPYGWWQDCNARELICTFRYYSIESEPLSDLELFDLGLKPNQPKERKRSVEKASFRLYYFADTVHFFREADIPFKLWNIAPTAPSIVGLNYRLFYRLPAQREYFLGDTLEINFGIISPKKEGVSVFGHSDKILYHPNTKVHTVNIVIREILKHSQPQTIPLLVDDQPVYIPYALNSFHLVDSAPPKQMSISEKELHVLRTHFTLSEWMDSTGKMIQRLPLNSYRSALPVPEPGVNYLVRFISYRPKKEVEFKLIYRPE